MNTSESLAALRAAMTVRGIDALVIPSGDPHQSEYVAAHWQARAWLTGFTGSAGTAVVTRDRAMLWTDFRYWIQARAQMKGFDLFKQGDQGVPEFDRWLADHLLEGSCVGLDGKMVSAAQARKLEAIFSDCGLTFHTDADLISPLWTNRPAMPASKAFVLEPRYCGETRVEKLARIRKKLGTLDAPVHLMATLDDIAWTFNLRGADVHTNPVNLAYALVMPDEAVLFINGDKIESDLARELTQDGVRIAPYEEVDKALDSLAPGTRIAMDPDRTSIHLFKRVAPDAVIVETPNPAVAFKARKNPVEINWLRETAVKDGRAVVRFLHWLETSGEPVTELTAAEKIRSFRAQEEDFINDSFDAIMAAEEHSAMCHYNASQDTDRAVTARGMFLTDSGGNYLTGTTDITRTLHTGTPSKEEKADYTLVLKGHISVATSRFPDGTRGYQIDTLARQFLWAQGMDFGHGTGHGVGFFLCVHEGPARISPHPVDQPLKPGMLLTNEPGLYREGKYGIRLENMVLVAEDTETEFGKFLKFENLTLCHFERSLMDRALLTDKEIAWVNNYHERVYEALSPGLEEDVKAWLAEKTRPLIVDFLP